MLVSEAFCQLYVKLLPISVSAFHLLTLIAIGIKCPLGDFFSVWSVIFFFMNIRLHLWGFVIVLYEGGGRLGFFCISELLFQNFNLTISNLCRSFIKNVILHKVNHPSQKVQFHHWKGYLEKNMYQPLRNDCSNTCTKELWWIWEIDVWDD